MASSSSSKIKDFFKKMKADAKFKRAGQGRALHDSEAPFTTSVAPSILPSKPRPKPSASSSKAAQAALNRSVPPPSSENFAQLRSRAVIRKEALRELEEEKELAAKQLEETGKQRVVLDGPPTNPGIFYHCPLMGPEKMPKEEMTRKIEAFLNERVEEEKGLTSCLIIHTLNSDNDKVRIGVDILTKYLDNIINNPSEEKYRKIRTGNRAYQEKVVVLRGHDIFLSAAGFVPQTIDEEEFWVHMEDSVENLEILKDALLIAEPIEAKLHRDTKVLLPTANTKDVSIHPDFFAITSGEIKREQQTRTDELEKNMMLRTKAMREKEKNMRNQTYRFTLIRVRFPDGLVLQGTFSVYETFQAVVDYVQESLDDVHSFSLAQFDKNLMGDIDKLIMNVEGLVPAAMLMFIPDEDRNTFLKPELIEMAQNTE